jgi:alpha-L-fucosidase
MPSHGAFKEDKVGWSVEDFRFTTKGDTVYAFQMKYPEGGAAAIRSLGKASGRAVRSVRMLGYGGDVAWEQAEQALVIRLPAERVAPSAPGFAVEVTK